MSLTDQATSERYRAVADRPVLTHRRVLERLVAAPVLASAAGALAVRAVVVLVMRAQSPWVAIPDETQYITLARWMADGGHPDGWAPHYGNTLYHATRGFLLPLVFVFRHISSSRAAGQVLAALFGVAAVAGTVYLVRRLAGPRWALAAGAVAALLPSQVLFSSVVLRESEVWLGLVLLGIACAIAVEATDPRRGVAAAALGAGAMLLVGLLRDQTLFVAMWCGVAAMAFSRRGHRLLRCGAALVLALLVPVTAGMGLGGWDLVVTAIPSLGSTRTVLAIDADSSFREVEQLVPGTSTPSPTTVPSPTTTTPPPDTVGWFDGARFVTDESAAADLKALPSGTVAVLLRPFPGEGTSSSSLRLASLENLVWYGLYGLAAVGAWFGIRERRSQVAFPVLLCLGMTASAAVSQGNLGTAFRHRQQLFWAVLVLAALGAGGLRERVEARRAPVRSHG